MSPSLAPHAAACHCGAVQFTLHLTSGFDSLRRCTCSYCRMRGAAVVSIEMAGITFLAGQDQLTLYQFNTKTAKHYFCKHCGIYTHHQRRSNPNLFGVNVACIAGVSPFDFPEIPVMDGITHPSDTGAGVIGAGDTGAGPQMAGILRFTAT